MIKIWIKKKVNFIKGFFNLLKFQLMDAKKIKHAEIVFFFPYYHTGGAERVHLNILQALEGIKCCVIFTHLSATKNFYNDFSKQGAIIELNSILNKKNNFINKQLKKSISQIINRNDSVYAVFGCNTNLYYEILPAISNTKRRIDLVHAFVPNDIRKNQFCNSASLLDVRIVINTKAKQDFIAIYEEAAINKSFINRIQIIENGVLVNHNYIRKINFIDFQQIKVAFIGRWSDEKCPEIFLEIVKRVKLRFSNVDFVMAGTGMKANISKIKEAGVVFLGEITKIEELNKLYKSVDIILITSIYEGFPMVLMEAMIHGVIPVCTNVGGISEHIKSMENGILINEIDKAKIIISFEKKISYLIENPHKTMEISRNAQDYAINNFSIERFNTAYKNVFKK